MGSTRRCSTAHSRELYTRLTQPLGSAGRRARLDRRAHPSVGGDLIAVRRGPMAVCSALVLPPPHPSPLHLHRIVACGTVMTKTLLHQCRVMQGRDIWADPLLAAMISGVIISDCPSMAGEMPPSSPGMPSPTTPAAGGDMATKVRCYFSVSDVLHSSSV